MKRGFTLIEVLIVLLVVAVLVAILLPVVTVAKRQGYITTCSSNMGQLGQALYLYASDHDGLAPPVSTTKSGSQNDDTWIEGDPRRWRDLIGGYAKGNTEIFWCHLDPNRANENFVAYGESHGTSRELYTSFQLSPLFKPKRFGSPNGVFRLNVDTVAPGWNKSPSETVYLTDALWYDESVVQPVLTSGHQDRRSNRLFLDGHVKSMPIIDQ